MAEKKYKYLSAGSLISLAKHKYSGKDDSILYNLVFTHVLDYVVAHFVPSWLAPNLITLIGTCTLILNLGIVSYYIPGLEAGPNTPSWICLLSAFCCFWYQMLDNMDGKQARKTGNNTPLGELFDHGCDSLVVMIQSLIVASIASFGVSWLFISQIILTWMLFWMSTWEAYHTGVLYLGPINGPQEGLHSIQAMLVFAYFVGPGFWTRDWKDVANVHVSWLPSVPINAVFVLLSMIPLILTAIGIVRRVLKHVRSEQKSVATALSHLVFFGIFASCVALWFRNSPTLWQQHPKLIVFTIGLSFGEMVSTLILKHMCKDHFNLFQRTLVPLLAATANSLIGTILGSPLVSEAIFLPIFVAMTWLSYIQFVQAVIHDICTFLGIRALTIPDKSSERKQK
eukprot:TRINITY_DN9019_c0_g1_i1.p1 TRINITY_DN9019_c0_g1~~TRINITY_DN9019_c0_g1_i1.p1  ORF type:complete len:417 (+),score=63.87 TRINITY_DN9019_c0_g1_i1:63-1253(+)